MAGIALVGHGQQHVAAVAQFAVDHDHVGGRIVHSRMKVHGRRNGVFKGGGNIGVYGYGILTNLNTGLAFDSVTAQITGHERIEITQQNFDFDFEQNILTVPLDLGTAHYFIEVRQASRN